MITAFDDKRTQAENAGSEMYKSDIQPSSKGYVFGLPAAAFIALLSLSVSLVFFLFAVYIYKFYSKHNKKKCELLALTPNLATTQPRIPGIRANEAIEFVVPTITMSGSTPFSLTEDSMSDSDYFGFTSGSDREGLGRRRHPAGRYQISPHEIRKVLYPDCEPADVKVDAKINLVLHYSFHRQQLLVTLLSAKNLPINEKKSKINPFAKVVLLPEKTPKFLTKVQKNNVNPIFNELFIFPAKRATLDHRVLKISLWDYDRFSRKSFIARTFYPLSNAQITSLVTSDVITDEIWAILSERKDISKTGEILVSLCYKPDSSTLTLGIIKVKNLSAKDSNSVYVKVVLYVRKKKIRMRKTQCRKFQHEIEFNDLFHVHIDYSSLSEVTIAITVCGRSTGSLSKHSFGRTFVGETCTSNQGVQHWFDMKQAMNSTVVQLHRLLP